jgi:diguanylate cyclase (GGDEF)-like protein
LYLQHTRKIDFVGRWGGEEFLITCPETDLTGLIQLAEKLRVKIEKYSFPNVGNITSSFGVTIYQNGDDVSQLISKADSALYQAKNRGRNCVVAYINEGENN